MNRALTAALAAVLAAATAACSSKPPHSWQADLEPRSADVVRTDGDLVARLGPLTVRLDDVILDRNRLAGVTLEFRNEGATDVAVVLQRLTSAPSSLRGSVSRPPMTGALSSSSTWEPWAESDGVSVAPGGRTVLGLAQSSVFERFPPLPEDEVALRVLARVDGADRTAEIRFRVTSLVEREEPNPFQR